MILTIRITCQSKLTMLYIYIKPQGEGQWPRALAKLIKVNIHLKYIRQPVTLNLEIGTFV